MDRVLLRRPRRPLGRQRQLIIDALLMGVAGAAAAQAFTYLLRGATWLFLTELAGYHPPGLPNEGGVLQEVLGPHGFWLIPVATTLGGLLVGALAQRLAPETEGHGTDTVVQAFHRAEGTLRARVAPIKMLASAITIGSGGSAGREGPIALTAAGLGSWYAQLTHRSAADRRRLLLVGMAAGIAAIFRSPVGAALFAIEVPYLDMEFESGTLLPAMLASVIAYALNGFFVGWQPLFRVPAQLTLSRVRRQRLVPGTRYRRGLVATLVPVLYYGVRDAFRQLPVPPGAEAGSGRVAHGTPGAGLPAGHRWWLRLDAGGDRWSTRGGSASRPGPREAAGDEPHDLVRRVGRRICPNARLSARCSGACSAILSHQPPAPFVVVGMAAVFAGAAHVPIASLMMVTEMTGGYTLLVPAALAVLVSYLVQRRLAHGVKYQGLYEAQVGARADSPAHHAEHLRIALRLLKERRLLAPTDVGELDLLSFLRAGIPVDLPGGRRLLIGVLRPDSPLCGQPASADGGILEGNTRIFAIIRGEHMMVPGPTTVLEAGDRLILVTGSERPGMAQAARGQVVA